MLAANIIIGMIIYACMQTVDNVLIKAKSLRKLINKKSNEERLD